MVDPADSGEKTVEAYECTRCGERLDDPEDACDDPLCDGEARRVATGRE